jgi:hypothetical protein
MDREQVSRWMEALPDMEEQKDKERERLIKDAYSAYQRLTGVVDPAIVGRMIDINRALESPWKDPGLDAAVKDPRHVEPYPKAPEGLRLLLGRGGLVLSGPGCPYGYGVPYLSYDTTFRIFRAEINRNINRMKDVRELEELFSKAADAFPSMVQTFYKELEEIAGKPDPEGKECLRLREERKNANYNGHDVQESLRQAFAAYKTLVDGLPEQWAVMNDMLGGLDNYTLLQDFYDVMDNLPENSVKVRSAVDQTVICIQYDDGASSFAPSRYHAGYFCMEFQKSRDTEEQVTLWFPYDIATPEEFAKHLSAKGFADIADNPERLDILKQEFDFMKEDFDAAEEAFSEAMETLLEQYMEKENQQRDMDIGG